MNTVDILKLVSNNGEEASPSIAVLFQLAVIIAVVESLEPLRQNHRSLNDFGGPTSQSMVTWQLAFITYNVMKIYSESWLNVDFEIKRCPRLIC